MGIPIVASVYIKPGLIFLDTVDEAIDCPFKRQKQVSRNFDLLEHAICFAYTLLTLQLKMPK